MEKEKTRRRKKEKMAIVHMISIMLSLIKLIYLFVWWVYGFTVPDHFSCDFLTNLRIGISTTLKTKIKTKKWEKKVNDNLFFKKWKN